MAQAAEIARMLRDIEREVTYTRDYIHYERFSDVVMAAMAAVPRHQFVPESMRQYAYDNGPLPIGHGQTISQPYIVALMTQLLEVDANSTVLEIGTGSGYQAAVLAQIVKQLYSIELVAILAQRAAERLQQLGYQNIAVRCSDGYHGWPEHGPYDGIIVTAVADEVPPALVDQLKAGGRMVIPVRGGVMGQELLLLQKDSAGRMQRDTVLPVAFVPLLHGS
jgi:protein-L-isoaspartate(D-aspartate) O-methyltransferase